ncbi:polysaccharide biosynthesis/export family protein [Reyranella sp.]|uniref:polysaccharide biosynthesis/export family protein n=1 Tax=Reyranella sp. TaxID=1929291 RepID=UPI003BA9E4C4
MAIVALTVLSACEGMPGSGPMSADFNAAARPTSTGQTRFALVEVDQNIVAVMERWQTASFRNTFGPTRPPATQTIGVGDSVQIVLWEAAAGGLFSAPAGDRLSPGQRSATIPEQVVGADGAVTVPYAGRIRAAHRTPKQVEEAIVHGLEGKAIEPQALVTVTKNVANTVTVVGEVSGGARIPLNAGGDRILDALASAGATKAPVHETFISLVRDGQSARVPMQSLLLNPRENIYVFPSDVITVTREPQTFTVVGATGQNSVLPFDAIGLTLDQAIGRAGGLNDQRADPMGVFVIRFEDPTNYDQLGLPRPAPGTTSQVPVIYRVNMRDPNSFFLARRFPMHNKDILFVSSSPATEMQKVVNLIIGFIVPGASVVAVSAAVR